jgi:hypothetical protein
MPEIEILKMLPAYMIPSAIVVWLFYQMLQHRDATLEKIADSFAVKIETLDLAHRKQIDSIVDQFREMQLASQENAKTLTADYILVTKEAIVAMAGMSNSEKEIKEWINQAKQVTKGG